MEINPDDYIVVIISSDKEAEKKILGSLERNNDNNEDWCYAAYNSSSGGILSKPANNGEHSSYNFFLINPECLRKSDGHRACTKIASLLSSIKERNKKKICWLHIGDTIPTTTIISTLGNLEVCVEFHHSDNVSDIDKNSPPEIFMFKVCKNGQNNFQNEFKKLIEASKPTPHLIAHSLRSQILTPFVALHLALQIEPKERETYLKNLSPEDFCNEGIEVLDNKGQELIRKFSELAGTPFEKEKALSQSQKDINEFIQDYAEPLSTIFQGIINNNQINLPSDVDVLAGIEQLSRIVEEGVEKSDLIKKARLIKHDLDSVLRRLDNCKSPLTPEKRGVMKSGMEMLDSIFKELNTLKETRHLDIQAELESASKLVQKIREGVKTNLEESRLLELRDELVSVLQEPFNMIVSVTTGQEK